MGRVQSHSQVKFSLWVHGRPQGCSKLLPREPSCAGLTVVSTAAQGTAHLKPVTIRRAIVPELTASLPDPRGQSPLLTGSDSVPSGSADTLHVVSTSSS